jgi:hypothetical protein
MVALDGGFLDRPVHSFDLAVRPEMFDLGEAVLDPVFVTDPIEDVMESGFVVGVISELDAPGSSPGLAVVGQHGVDGIWHGCDQVAQELGGDHLACLCVQLDEGELAGPVDCHEQA